MFRSVTRIAAPIVVALPLFLAACSDNDRDVCNAREDVSESLQALLDINVIQEGTNAVKDAFEQLQGDLSSLEDAASEEFNDEVSAVRDATNEVKTVIDETEGDPLPDRASAITEALSSLRGSIEGLLQAVGTTCD